MKKLLIDIAILSVFIIWFTSCNQDKSNLSSTPDLSAAGEDNATLTVKIKTNGGPVRTFQLHAIAWDEAQDMQSDIFYWVSVEKESAFLEKVELKKGKSTATMKKKALENTDSPKLAGYDSGPGLFAYASASCGQSSCTGNTSTTADANYYSKKTHEHEFWSHGNHYYYSHEDGNWEGSEIDILYENDYPKLSSSSSVVRYDYYYKLKIYPPIGVILSFSPPDEDDFVTSIPNPPHDPTEVWKKIAGDCVSASDNCGF